MGADDEAFNLRNYRFVKLGEAVREERERAATAQAEITKQVLTLHLGGKQSWAEIAPHLELSEAETAARYEPEVEAFWAQEVAFARKIGTSWTKIGVWLGVSARVAQRRYGHL